MKRKDELEAFRRFEAVDGQAVWEGVLEARRHLLHQEAVIAMTGASGFLNKAKRMLGLSLHGWENLMVGSLVFAAMAEAIVGVSTWAVVRLQRQELAGSKIEFDTYKLETAKHIADANSAGEAAKADEKVSELIPIVPSWGASNIRLVLTGKNL
jgi:hypothetical protein